MQSDKKQWQERGNMNAISIAPILAIVLLTSCRESGDSTRYTEFYKPVPGQLPYFKGEDLNPYWKTGEHLPNNLKQLGSFSCTRENGDTVTEKDVRGKFVLVGFFFSRCAGICPMVTANIKRISDKITDQGNLLLLSISIDPDNDRQEQLQEFKSRFDSKKNNWMFLTGPKAAIYEMARKVFNADIVVPSRKGADDFVHTENVYLLDTDGYLRGIYRAKGIGDIDRLITDLKILRSARTS